MSSSRQNSFNGFRVGAAKTSLFLETVFKNTIRNLECSNKNIASSTPARDSLCVAAIMEHFFAKFEGSSKLDINITMDHDSGYISNNHESNSDSSLEVEVATAGTLMWPKPIYLSEDALLEKPEINVKHVHLNAEIEREDYDETKRLFNSPDSIVETSVISQRTEYSGFLNETDQSDLSTELYTINEIVYNPYCSPAASQGDSLATVSASETENNSNVSQAASTSILNATNYVDNTEICGSVENVSANIETSVECTHVLGNVTNTCINLKEKDVIDGKIAKPKPKKFFTDKENVVKPVRVSRTPKKAFKNPVDSNYSPDLFDDDVEQCDKQDVKQRSNVAVEKYIIRKDQRLLRRVQNGLNGVLPPPSVTIVQMSVGEILTKIADNKQYFWKNSQEIAKMNVDDGESNKNSSINSSVDIKFDSKSMLVTTENVNKEWPRILEERYHGLHHNRSKLSEEFELLCDKYAQRCVGAETQSTCTVFENTFVSPTKRKATKQRWAVKSPGRRLSHLARRRITFSSANLQAGGSSVSGSRTRQILMDAKKMDLLNRRKSPRKSPRKTPKKTPGKSPRCKTRTPSSSAKKKLALRFRKLTGEFEKTVPSTSDSLTLSSKRALFQSPDRDKASHLLPSTSGLSTFNNELKKMPSKRALFSSPRKNSPRKNSPFKRSPFKKSPFKSGFEKKRKRSESDDSHPYKLPRSMSCSSDIRPSDSEVKTFNRTKSESNVLRPQAGELSAIHKKKLQWAVYEALRTQNITHTHPQFKVFASILARVTRRFLPNLSGNAPRPEGGTSDRMLRIARHHVFAVVKGKSVDEIINEYMRNRTKNQKPQGYVGVEEFNNSMRSKESVMNKENVFRGKSNVALCNEEKKLELEKPKAVIENKIDRIRKVINFGDDDNR